MRNLSIYRWLLRPLTTRLVSALAGLVLLATAAPAPAQTPTFSAVVSTATGGVNCRPASVAVADVNGDGKPDALLANENTSTLAVLLGDGAGSFTLQANSPFTGGSGPFSVAVADVNGDGKPDALLANYASNTLAVLLGDGKGGFTLHASPSTGDYSGPTSVAVADVNGDGKPDALLANQTTSTLGVLLGNGAGGFTLQAASPSTGVNSNPYSVAVADVNGDGKPDALLANENTSTLAVLLGDGAGSFTLQANSPSTGGSGPQSVAVADVNGDGKPDALLANYTNSTLGVLLGDGAGGFTLQAASPSIGVNTGPISVAVADVNSDGKPDALLANYNTSTLAVLLGNGAGDFTLQAVSPSTGVNTGPYSVVVADVNGDGKPDLLTANYSTGTAGVLLNTTVYAAPTLTSLSPVSGPVGTRVTLTGTTLSGATGVSFNGTAATTFAVVSATTATATVPPGTTTGIVTITTPGGTSNGLVFTLGTDLVVSTGTQLSPTPIPAGDYSSITVTPTGNGVLAGDVTVASFLTVQPGGGLSDGCHLLRGAGSFTLGAGSVLGICNAAGITSSGPAGTVLVTGTRAFSPLASYGYTGAAAVTGNGLPGTVASLAINTATDVTLTAPVAVTVGLGVGGAGNLVLNGNALTLLSAASGTALVVNAGAGKVIGATATVQRYIDPSLNPGPGYRHYSAPVSNTTVADLATAGFSPDVSQAAAYNTSAAPGTTSPFPTVFAYDQARLASATNNLSAFDKGFVVPASPDVPLAVGQGYAVNIDAAQLVDFVGTLTTGDQTLALARNPAAAADAATAGWQLLGNPYPAPLDYGRVAPTDRPNLDAAIYVYSSTGPYLGTYRAFLPPTTGSEAIGDGVLPVAQGFFVRVSAGQPSGSLTFRNAQRLTSPQATPFQRGTAGTRPLVQLELRGATGPADPFYAYTTAGATPAFDSQFDAIKLPNTTGLNLASTATSGESLAIDARPAFAAATVLPLTVGVPAAGTYTLSAAALTNLPAGLDAYLHDALTGQTINLRQQPRYAFAVSPAQAQAGLSTRFSLGFSPQGILATRAGLSADEVSLFPNPAHASFTVLVPAVTGTSQLRAELLNALGQVVRRLSAALPADGVSLHVDTAGLAGGVYSLRLSTGPTTLTKRVVLQ